MNQHCPKRRFTACNKIHHQKTQNLCPCTYNVFVAIVLSINFFHSWATPTSSRWAAATKTTIWHSTFWHATPTTCSLIHLHHDWIYNALKFLLLSLKFIFFSELIFVQPIKSVLHSFFNFFLVTSFKFLLEFLFVESVAHCE